MNKVIDWVMDILEPLGIPGCWIAIIIFGLIFVFGGASCQALITGT